MSCPKCGYEEVVQEPIHAGTDDRLHWFLYYSCDLRQKVGINYCPGCGYHLPSEINTETERLKIREIGNTLKYLGITSGKLQIGQEAQHLLLQELAALKIRLSIMKGHYLSITKKSIIHKLLYRDVLECFIRLEDYVLERMDSIKDMEVVD